MKCWLRTKHPFEHHRKRLRMSVAVIRPHWKWQTNDWFKSLVSVCNCSWFRDAFHVVCASDVLAWRRECSVCMSTLMRTRVKALTTKWGRATFQSKNWSFLFILQTLNTSKKCILGNREVINTKSDDKCSVLTFCHLLVSNINTKERKTGHDLSGFVDCGCLFTDLYTDGNHLKIYWYTVLK